MAKMTLLEIVQSIENDMDGDQVNSIDDTFESEQIASIVKDSFYAMVSNRNWPHLHKLVQLESSGDAALPTHVTLPDNIKRMLTLNYNKVKSGETRRKYEAVSYIEPDDFLRLSNGRNSDDTNTDIITDPTGVELVLYNNAAPTYYTTFDDQSLVMDSYDLNVDTTIQQSKIQARAVVTPPWTHVDTFIPDLPDVAFTALLEEAKSRCMLRLKQTQDIKSEQEASRQQTYLSRQARKAAGGLTYPNYGRKGNKTASDSTFGRG